MFLDNNGVDYIEHDVTQSTERFDEVVEMGYKGTPVVRWEKENSHGHFSGLNLKELQELVS